MIKKPLFFLLIRIQTVPHLWRNGCKGWQASLFVGSWVLVLQFYGYLHERCFNNILPGNLLKEKLNPDHFVRVITRLSWPEILEN
jgi:hypothetical protein